MRKETQAVHNLHEFLKYKIQPLVENTEEMLHGQNVVQILQRPRELLGNFLISVLESAGTGFKYTIASDPDEQDGIILNISDGHDGEYLWMEHVFVPEFIPGLPTEAILNAIHSKVGKYGNSKNLSLVVFSDKEGVVDNAMIRNQIRETPNYEYNCTYVIGHNSLYYNEYGIARITDKLRLYTVKINESWDDWAVDFVGVVDEK